ncbi:MAG: hypothetical protein IIZ89_03390, partial [Muribaculaceae bacterium]|nr:hypothetical protein [Muribaculaceae bacterium]
KRTTNIAFIILVMQSNPTPLPKSRTPSPKQVKAPASPFHFLPQETDFQKLAGKRCLGIVFYC